MTRNRVKILQLLETTQTGKPFFSILSKHIIYLLEKREKSMENDDWVVQEACSPHGLQEGGTFRKTLWLKLRNLVSTAIAIITRITDGDNNLDLLSQDNKASLNLWLETFQSPFITKALSWPRYDKNLNLIVNSQNRFNCRFPFSRRITEELVNSWNMLKGRNNMPVAFFNKVSHSQLQPILNAAAETDTINNVTCYISDLTHILYKEDASMEEYQAVQKCMLALFRGYRNKNGPKHNAVLEAFVLFMESNAQLKVLSEVLNFQPEILRDVDQWVEDQTNQDTFVVALSAFDSLVKYLVDGVPKIDKVDFCEKWKDVVSKAKHVAEAILLNKSTSSKLKESWRRIVFVQMFLEQLVPNASPTSPLARRLWSGARTIQDLSDIRFLNILTKTLKRCLQEIKLKLLCSWETLQCRVCKKDKLVKPVKLPCRHYICQACVPVGNPEQSCPICRKKIPPNWEVQPVALQPDDRKVLNQFEVACQSFFLDYLSTLCFPSTQTAYAEKAQPPDKKVIYALEKFVICNNTTQTISPIRQHFDQTPTVRSFILQLLLRCNRQSVQHHLDLQFQNMANIVDKKSLMDVYTQCWQDMMIHLSPGDAADLFN
uniref:RING-type domain-containing protein n=1 Tax=Ciona savignyi TaxID=51511 RepID=H2YLI2_CIOSA